MMEIGTKARSTVVPRPHFRRDGSSLYFFLSSRPYRSLSEAERRIWDRLEQGPSTFQDLGDPDAIRALIDAQIIDIIEPIDSSNRKQILVIEPHSDDAALSIGGTMWKMRHDVEFHLLTMASRSNYTSAFQLHRDYFDRTQITAMRTSEGELFVQHLGGHYYCAGMNEATLRYDDSDWNLDFFEAHEVPVAISNNRKADKAVLARWLARLSDFIKERSYDEIWMPLGVGTHSDHDLTRNAALQALMESRPKATIRLYEDVPYGGHFREHTDRILRSLAQAGADLVPWTQDVTDDFPKKLSLLNIFASQFKVSSIQAGVEHNAGDEGPERRVERMWTLEGAPSRLPEDDLWVGAPKVKEAARFLPGFTRDADTTTRVALFAISAAGRWSCDLEFLKAVFPNARLVVYATMATLAEFEAVRDSRVNLLPVETGSMAWLKAALREVTTSHRIIIAGRSVAKAKRLELLWPFGRTIIVSDMDNLMQAFAYQSRNQSHRT